MKIKQIDFNWRQEGSVQDSNGAVENPVWDVDIDKIRQQVREEYELFCGISAKKD